LERASGFFEKCLRAIATKAKKICTYKNEPEKEGKIG
jgi:hypothetical protein